MSTNKIPVFRTYHDGIQKTISDASATDFTVPDDDADYHPSRSLTNQSDTLDSDINNIMARYLKTGLVPQSLAKPFFGDASALPSFMEAQQILIDANLAFEALPAKIRDRFNNSPAKFLEFMGDEDNKSEALALGLLKPEDEALPEAPPKEPAKGKASSAPSEAQE